MLSLNFFNIIGLYGTKDIRLQFENNRLIIVGENGSGKTTVLRLFYYFISCQWNQLLNYNFVFVDKLLQCGVVFFKTAAAKIQFERFVQLVFVNLLALNSVSKHLITFV